MIEATTNDIQKIVDLVNTAYRSKEIQGWTSESDLVLGDRINSQQVQQLICQDAKLFLLFDAAELIGCVHLHIQQQSCYIGMLTTHPKTQNRGLGKQILEFAESFSKHQFATQTFKMSVLSNRPELIAFYQRRGYQLTGYSEPYPINANVGIPLDQNIAILHLEKRV